MEGPIDTGSAHLNSILQDLFRDIPLGFFGALKYAHKYGQIRQMEVNQVQEYMNRCDLADRMVEQEVLVNILTAGGKIVAALIEDVEDYKRSRLVSFGYKNTEGETED